MNTSHRRHNDNCNEVTIGRVTIGYSYATAVTVHGPAGSATRENVWGNTTGRHIGMLGGHRKGERVDEETFNKVLERNLTLVAADAGFPA